MTWPNTRQTSAGLILNTAVNSSLGGDVMEKDTRANFDFNISLAVEGALTKNCAAAFSVSSESCLRTIAKIGLLLVLEARQRRVKDLFQS